MSARKRTRRYKAYWVEWTPSIASLFDLPPGSWTPPTQARVHRGQQHLTVVARYSTPDGRGAKATARIQLTAGGGGIQTEESWDMRFALQLGGAEA
ncbi:MAG: hypothetical protein JWP35_3513 [Caulobacter sp.]|nr:hypothetical protein [Caulobacter sp.]